MVKEHWGCGSKFKMMSFYVIHDDSVAVQCPVHTPLYASHLCEWPNMGNTHPRNERPPPLHTHTHKLSP